jgi:hypothetical protein
MSAYNWINLESQCPACGSTAAIRCQTHVASDYDGDARGRFHDREYGLGDKMWWWADNDPRYPDWRVLGRPGIDEDEYDEEACYSTCGACGANLCVVLGFRKIVPTTIVRVVKEEEWPEGYPK